MVPYGRYLFGDGYSEPGSFLSLNADNLVFDAGRATIIGNVIVGDLANYATCPNNVLVWGGVYAPDTSSAPFNSGRYFSYSNACGIAAGTNVVFLGVTTVAAQYVRGFSIQTDVLYTGNGGVPIQGVQVIGLTILCDDCPDGLDISSSGADGLIRDVTVQAVIRGTPRRGLNVNSGGAVDRIYNVNVMAEVRGSIDIAGKIYYTADSRFDLIATDQQWQGFDCNLPTSRNSLRLSAQAVPTQNPASPPTGSGLAANSNYGCNVAGAAGELVDIQLDLRGPFRNGLLPTRDSTLYPYVRISGTSSTPIVAGPYDHVFGQVYLDNVPSLAVLSDPSEQWGDVYVQASSQWTRRRGRRVPTRTITGNLTLDPDADAYVEADTTSGNITVTLPSAANGIGRTYTVKKLVAGNTLTLAAAGADLIDGVANIAITTQWDSRTVVSTGSAWRII